MSDRPQEPLFANGGDDRVPVVYVATPLSGLPEHDRLLLDAWAQVVDSAVFDEVRGSERPWDVSLHIPLRVSAPWNPDGREPSEIYELNTAKMWSESDGLIVFSYNGGSIGAGMELVWADLLGIPVLVLCQAKQTVSRQVSGATEHSDITVKEFGTAAQLRDVVRQSSPRSWCRRFVLSSSVKTLVAQTAWSSSTSSSSVRWGRCSSSGPIDCWLM